MSDKKAKRRSLLDQLLEIMSDDVRSGASIRRIRQMKDKSLKQQIAVTDRASFQNRTLSRFRPARPSTPSMGTAPNNHDLRHNHLEASRHIFSSQCNIQQASTPKGSCKPFFSYQDVHALNPVNGGAKRDRTADPLLAKQVLSQLSYSPDFFCPHAAAACAASLRTGRRTIADGRLA